MTVAVDRYTLDDLASWNDLVRNSVNGTFLHSQTYISYHGARFQDQSLVFRDRRDRIVGILPAATDPNDSTRVVSHPGLTYGGLVHDGSLRGEGAIDALRLALNVWRSSGMASVRYKAVPHIYHRVPAEDDLYALFRLGARLSRRDLSTSIDLSTDAGPNRNRRRNLEKAQGLGLRLTSNTEHLKVFWPILERNLRERFGVAPVHTLDEVTTLAERFPSEIECQLVTLGSEPVAGTVLYKTMTVVHPQYSAATDQGREVAALDVAFQSGIDAARSSGHRFYDFGVSTVNQGTELNAPLYQFKTTFGGGGVMYDFVDIAL